MSEHDNVDVPVRIDISRNNDLRGINIRFQPKVCDGYHNLT